MIESAADSSAPLRQRVRNCMKMLGLQGCDRKRRTLIVRTSESQKVQRSSAQTGYPHPGCFGKRGWICLIAKDLTFLEERKRLQIIETSKVKGRVTGEVCEVCSR